MTSKSAPNVGSLFQNAQADGALSPAAAQVINVPDLGAQIQANLGISVDDITASEVVLVTILIDDSGSIRYVAGNCEAVRDGHNAVLDALGASKQNSAILCCTLYLNGTVLFPYTELQNAVRMSSRNYNPNGGTPLYDQTLVTLGTVLAKAQEFADSGVPCRTVTLIVTDGADVHSRRKAADCKKLVADMRRAETHIVAAMGIDDGGQTDFRQVFAAMGIEDRWILTPGQNPSDIRKAFEVFSQSAARASQSAQNFSAAAGGGFATP